MLRLPLPRRLALAAGLLCLCVPAASWGFVVDISSAFDTDTLAISDGEPTGGGYRGNSEVFISNAYATAKPDPQGRPNLPDDGLIAIGGRTFRVGPFSPENALNTLILQGSPASDNAATIDVPDARYSDIAVLHTAVGFQDNSNGTVTLHYTDGTSSTPATWDLVDSDGNKNDSLAQEAIAGLTVWDADTHSPPATNERRWWYQAFTADPGKVLDTITLSVAGVTDGDADIGVYAIDGSKTLNTLQASFNRDTIAISSAEPTGGGYRHRSEVFITENFNGGTNTPNVPASGIVRAGIHTFHLGPFDGNNTLVLGVDQDAEVDLADGRYARAGILFSAVGYNPASTDNGTAVFFYTDGTTSGELVWDVVDSNGAGNEGLAATAISGMDLYDADPPGTIIAANNRYWFYQTFELDPSRILDYAIFSTAGIDDAYGGDAEFGIYAISLIPEPATTLLLAAGLVPLLARRRRTKP